MQFEILNTIQYLVVLLITLLIYRKTKVKFEKLKWSYFFTGVLAITLFTHQQFYTLTEKVDTVKTQNIMSLQSNDIINDKVLDNYLKGKQNKDSETKVETTEDLLVKQKALSEKLAQQIENKHKENK